MESVVKHVLGKIKAAKVETDIKSYPYIIINDLFPQDYYEELVSVLKSMDKNAFSKLSKVYQTRCVYDVYRGENFNREVQTFNDLKPEEKTFWKKFQYVFLEKDDLKYAFIEKYKDYMNFPDYRYGTATCRIQRDFKGYSIGPHRDRLDKLFSAMIYTPTIDNINEDLKIDHGTHICAPKFEDPETLPLKEEHVGEGADRHFSFDDVSIVKTAPCEPNSLFSWAVADRSYHGVTPLESNLMRSTLAYFVKIPKHLTDYHKLYGSKEFKG